MSAKRTLAALVVIVAVVMFSFAVYQYPVKHEEPTYPGAPADSWCNADFAKRIDVNVNNTGGGALTNYQVYVNLSANPINETSLRAYNATSCTLRQHWCENITNGNCTKLWINYSGVGASTWTNDTAIYYSNPTATSTSNGDATFELFDHFDELWCDCNWTRSTNNPVLQAEGSGWEEDEVEDPFLISVGDTYYIYYCGEKGANAQIGVATSSDLMGTFTKYSNNPIISNSEPWTSSAVGSQVILTDIETLAPVQVDGKYYMFYWGDIFTTNAKMGYATSTDFYNWTKYLSNPVFVPSGTPRASRGNIVEDGDTYYLVYTGDGTNSYFAVYLASSTDLINWIEMGCIFDHRGETGEWDDGTNCGEYPQISKRDGTYYLLWAAGGGIPERQGLASCSTINGTYTKVQAAPVFSESGSGFDAYDVSDGYIIQDSGYDYIVYAGEAVQSGAEKIGIARCDDVRDQECPPCSPEKWEMGEDPTIENSYIKCKYIPEQYESASSKVAFDCPTILEGKGKLDAIDSSRYQWFGLNTPQASGAAIDGCLFEQNKNYAATNAWYGDGSNHYRTMLAVDYGAGGAEHIFKIAWTDSSYIFYVDDDVKHTETTNHVNTGTRYVDIVNAYAQKTIQFDWIFIRKYASLEPSITLGDEEDGPANNHITITGGNRGLLCNWTFHTTFANIAANLTNCTDFFYYNSTSQKWSFYSINRTINADTVIHKHAAIFVHFNATTTVNCNVLAPETITIPVNVYYYTALRESAAKTLTEINTAITSDGCVITDLYAWNSAAGAYTNTGSYSVLPNEGVAIYATTGCSWDGAV